MSGVADHLPFSTASFEKMYAAGPKCLGLSASAIWRCNNVPMCDGACVWRTGDDIAVMSDLISTGRISFVTFKGVLPSSAICVRFCSCRQSDNHQRKCSASSFIAVSRRFPKLDRTPRVLSCQRHCIAPQPKKRSRPLPK